MIYVYVCGINYYFTTKEKDTRRKHLGLGLFRFLLNLATVFRVSCTEHLGLESLEVGIANLLGED